MTPSLSYLISQLNFDWVNKNITEVNFPIQPEDLIESEKEYKLFRFGNISSEIAVTEMNKENFRCATMREALIWALKNWDRKSVVLAFDQCWFACDFKGKLILDLFFYYGEHDLYWFSSDEGFYFLGVRK